MLIPTRLYEGMNSYVALQAREADDAVTALPREIFLVLRIAESLKRLRESSDPNVVLETADGILRRLKRIEPALLQYHEGVRQERLRKLAPTINNARAQALAISEPDRTRFGITQELSMLDSERDPDAIQRRAENLLWLASQARHSLREASQAAKAVRKAGKPHRRAA